MNISREVLQIPLQRRRRPPEAPYGRDPVTEEPNPRPAERLLDVERSIFRPGIRALPWNPWAPDMGMDAPFVTDALTGLRYPNLNYTPYGTAVGHHVYTLRNQGGIESPWAYSEPNTRPLRDRLAQAIDDMQEAQADDEALRFEMQDDGDA